MNIHEHLANLDFPLKMAEDRVVENAIVLMRVIDMETGVRSFAIAASDGTDEIVAAGLLAVAIDVSTEYGWDDVDKDDN